MSFDYDLQIIASEDPYPTYRWMRDNDPAHYSESEDVWVLSRYEDCSRAFRDPETWSSERRGNLLNDLPDRVGKTLGTTDPPRHTFARGLVNKAFTPKTVRDLQETIRDIAHDLCSKAREKGTIEFVNDISAPYNASILGAMFGVPKDQFIQLRGWLDDFFKREVAEPGKEARQDVAMRELHQAMTALAEDRLEKPEDDLMSAMLYAEEDGRKLDFEQVVVTTMTFLTAGFESTNNQFTNLTYALHLHPDVLAEVKENLDLVPRLIEEGMRYDAPAQGFVRTPTRDVELHGKTIPENSQVLMHIGSANRDEREFEDPDDFDILRDNKNHLGMGQGIHYCVGAPLARSMASTLFEELLSMSERWEPDMEAAERVTTPNFRGFTSLPLTIA